MNAPECYTPENFPKISWLEYTKFYVRYFGSDLHFDQRLGQAFMNEYRIRPDAALFYCENVNRCKQMILERYVE